MPSYIRISASVRRRLGRTADLLAIGDGVPETAECYSCHKVCRPQTETTDLSVAVVGSINITLWSHPGCASSHVFTDKELATLDPNKKPPDVQPHSAVLVDPEDGDE